MTKTRQRKKVVGLFKALPFGMWIPGNLFIYDFAHPLIKKRALPDCLLPKSTLHRALLRQPGYHISDHCILKQTRGFASPPFDEFAFIGIGWASYIISDGCGFVKSQSTARTHRLPSMTYRITSSTLNCSIPNLSSVRPRRQ
jgi:hypothetical protein